MSCGRKSKYGLKVMRKLGCSSVEDLKEQLEYIDNESRRREIVRAIKNLEEHRDSPDFPKEEINQLWKDGVMKDLQGFSGSDYEDYTHSSIPMLGLKMYLSPGTQFFEKKTGCRSLVSDISSYQIYPKVKQEEFQSWTLTRKPGGKGFLLVGTDGNDNIIAKQNYGEDEINFPLDEIKFFVERVDNVGKQIKFELPNEH